MVEDSDRMIKILAIIVMSVVFPPLGIIFLVLYLAKFLNQIYQVLVYGLMLKNHKLQLKRHEIELKCGELELKEQELNQGSQNLFDFFVDDIDDLDKRDKWKRFRGH